MDSMNDTSQAALRDQVIQQVESYFAPESVLKDENISQYMAPCCMVPLEKLAGFYRMKQLTSDLSFLQQALSQSANLVIREDTKGAMWVGPFPQAMDKSRCTVILRDCPEECALGDIQRLVAPPIYFIYKFPRTQVRYVIFCTPDQCKEAFFQLQNQQLCGTPFIAQIKTDNIERGLLNCVDQGPVFRRVKMQNMMQQPFAYPPMYATNVMPYGQPYGYPPAAYYAPGPMQMPMMPPMLKEEFAEKTEVVRQELEVRETGEGEQKGQFNQGGPRKQNGSRNRNRNNRERRPQNAPALTLENFPTLDESAPTTQAATSCTLNFKCAATKKLEEPVNPPQRQEQPKQQEPQPKKEEKGNVNPRKGTNDAAAVSSTIRISNLPMGTTENELQAHFGPTGDIQRVFVSKNDNGSGKGFAYLTYAQESAAVSAVAKLNHSAFKNMNLRVEYGKPQTSVGGLKGGKPKGG